MDAYAENAALSRANVLHCTHKYLWVLSGKYHLTDGTKKNATEQGLCSAEKMTFTVVGPGKCNMQRNVCVHYLKNLRQLCRGSNKKLIAKNYLCSSEHKRKT